MIDKWKQFYNKSDITQIYIDNPFCSRVCSFCAYRGQLCNKNDYDYYYNVLLPNYIRKNQEIINMFSGQSYWIGGGTPSLMNIEDMKNIFSMLGFDRLDNHKVIETHPSSLTFDKINIFKKYNFNTIVIGVQTFDKNVLELHNRNFIDKKIIEEFIKYIHSLKMKVVVDLLVLQGSNTKTFYDDMKIISDYNVDEIAIAYDYKWKNDDKINKSFVDTVLEFTSNSEYKIQSSVLDIYDWMKRKNGAQLTKKGIDHYDVVKYISTLGYSKGKDNLSTLGIGGWKNRKVYSTINNKFQYYSTFTDHEEIVIL